MQATFGSLRNPEFFWFWMMRLAASATMQMGSVASGWLAYELTGSALTLGWLSTARGAARLILSLYAGALADRFEKRTLLLVTRGLFAVNALVLATLILAGHIQIWHLIAYSFINGVVSSFMMPAQQSILPEIVGSRRLMNASSLVSLGRGIVSIIAAPLAGLVINWSGAGNVYLMVVALYLVGFYCITRLPAHGVVEHAPTGVMTDLREGVAYARRSPLIPTLLFIALIRIVLGWSTGTLMPVYAKDVLHFDARGLGVLTAAPSVGELISSLALATLGNSGSKGKIMLSAGLVLGASLIVFGLLKPFWIVLLSLVFLGAARNAAMVTNNTLVQVNTAPEFRGRVMAMYMMIMGFMPLGTVPAAAMADVWGVPPVMLLQGVLLVAIFAGLWLFRPALRAPENQRRPETAS